MERTREDAAKKLANAYLMIGEFATAVTVVTTFVTSPETINRVAGQCIIHGHLAFALQIAEIDFEDDSYVDLSPNPWTSLVRREIVSFLRQRCLETGWLYGLIRTAKVMGEEVTATELDILADQVVRT